MFESPIPSSWKSLIIAVIVVVCINRVKQGLLRANRFPGPSLGHLFLRRRELQENVPWITLKQLSKKYGDIMQISIAGTTIIVLNKAIDAHNLLEKRSAIFSSRPRSILQGEIAGLEHLTFTQRYGEDFRTLRRFTTQFFNSRDQTYMLTLLQNEINILLRKLLKESSKFEEHLSRISSNIMIKSTYGDKVAADDDSCFTPTHESSIATNAIGNIGLTVVDVFPVLRYILPWVPGVDIIRRARQARVCIDRMVNTPYKQVKSQRESGLHGSSFVDSLLDEHEAKAILNEKQEFLIKNAAASIQGAGVETTEVVLSCFVFQMLHNPRIAKKAQDEIDRAIEKGQLPTLKDRSKLPYIDCILKELFRFNPPAPLALAHASIQEDTYKDKIIPNGSIVVPNLWAMMHDEQYYLDPYTFDPDRYLQESPPDTAVRGDASFTPDDPTSLIFGFGRRICPGRFFADTNIWLIMASILTVFDILPVIDQDTGKEILPDLEWTSTFVAKIKSFDARFVPRSDAHLKLVPQE